MGRLLWLIEAAEATGYPVVVVEGWETRGNSVNYDPHVVVAHHTAGPPVGDMPSLGIITNGRRDLPGPLSNYGLGRSGTIYVVASGKSNNAGPGDWTADGETYNSNYDTVGIEAENDGKQPWPDIQLDSYGKLCAEILRRINHDASHLCGHKEWANPPGRKVDPHDIDQDQARIRVQELLEGDDEVTPDEARKIIREELARILQPNEDGVSPVSKTVWNHEGATMDRTGHDTQKLLSDIWTNTKKD